MTHNPHRRIIASAVITAISAALLAGCGSTSSSSGGSEASTAASFTFMVGPGATSPLLQLEEQAKAAGVFSTANWNVSQIASAASGAELASALAGGSADIALQVPNAAFGLMAQGQCLQFLTANNAVVSSLISLPDLPLTHQGEAYPASALDLKGKTVGVVSLGGSQESITNLVLADAGLKPSDVTYVAVGAPQQAALALQNKQVDILYMTPPADVVLGAGNYQTVVDLAGTPDAPGQGAVQSLYATTCEYAEAHPDVIQTFCRGAQEIRDWALDPASKEALMTDMKSALGFTDAQAQETYDRYMTKIWPASVAITPEVWAQQQLWYGKEPPPYDTSVNAGCQQSVAAAGSAPTSATGAQG
ncbi:hypothetical protein GIS00_01235 [Nakamurella sp. YIM 132087]|uniref:SsuA/THI5-like domain-containing protein n=1 Tax=Nakamurella alba TaxID=2665158 RepID=A0A7K1FEP2_9ACTN|nr:ABC transporter substrate-binding protein [Nakamurella alba]MTD12568.1 hypothetical protein [Nakamurella alba]